MRLVSLQLVNFQVHTGLIIDFSPGITTIVGPTDHGKSSILRALRWVCLNDLSGEQFIREGRKSCAVCLFVVRFPGNPFEATRSSL